MKKDKPEIPENIQAKWQRIVDLMAIIINVPAALIMRKDEAIIEVFKANYSENNPFKENNKYDINGVYCEWVIDRQKQLLVPNALKDKKWDHNPDLEFNMISYLGFPITWPDRTHFGTICVSDIKENFYNDLHINLLQQFRDDVNSDLELMMQKHELEQEIIKHQHTEEELIHKNYQLQKFNDIMINREIRIVELKKEVNELCKKNSTKLRYEFSENL